MDVSFEQYKDGKYSALDMGVYSYGSSAFFLLKKITSGKRTLLIRNTSISLKMLVKRDFGLVLSDEEYVEVADYVFDKIKK